MSRVNLLRATPDRRVHAGRSSGWSRSRVACGAILALTSSGLVWWWLSLQGAIRQAEADLLRARQELSRLRTTIARADARNRGSDALLQRVEALESLRVRQSVTLTVVETIGSSIPGSCWLTAIVYEAGIPVRVEGRARQLGSIFEFAERLEVSRAFDGVRIVESRLETNDTHEPLVAFTVEALSAATDRVRIVAASPVHRRAGTE